MPARTTKKNDIFRVNVTALSNMGYGIAHLPDGMVIFVPGTVPGDVIDAKVIKIASGYAVGHLEAVITASPERPAEPFCSAPASCGGCVYRDVTYERELQYKHDDVVASFRKAGLSDVTVEAVRATGVTTGYRNKGQYPVAAGKDGPVAGFYAAKTHRVIAAEACPLLPPVFADIMKTVCAFAKEYNVPAYDETTGKGLLRHVYLRMGFVSGQILVCPVINGKTLPHADALVAALREKFPAVCGIVLNHNMQNTNVVLGETYTTLWGTPYLTDVLCGLTLRIDPAAFYQVNHDATELLYGIAAEKTDLQGTETLLDLYCGIGSIGLSMAHKVQSVFGIEIVPEAAACAAQNAAANGITNARFVCGDASDAEKFLAAAAVDGTPVDPDVVVLDPPRKGTTPELIEAIAKRNVPKIVYISCNHETLARDCALFREKGYTLGTVTPVDLFPRTGHVETVIGLCLKEKK